MFNKTSFIKSALTASIVLSATTNVAIADDSNLTFGYIQDEAPFSSINSVTGQADGYTVELCHAIAHSMDIDGSKVNFVPMTLDDGIQKIANNEIDMLCSAIIPTTERRQQASFSIPVFQGGISAIIREDAAHDLKRVLEGKPAHDGPKWRATINRGLANHTYVVHKDTVTEEWVKNQVKHLGVIAKVVSVDTDEQGLEMVNSGEADAYFGELSSLSNELNKSGLTNLELSGQVYDTAMLSLAVPRNNDDFRFAVDKALSDAYNSNEFTEVYQRYFGHQNDESLEAIKHFSLK